MKNYRENELKWYILAYLFLLIGATTPKLFSSGNIDWLGNIENLLSSTLLAGVICALSFVFDCLYTPTLKEALLFLGFTTMPGKTIFSRLSQGKINDIRFENKKAQEEYEEIISNLPSDENQKKAYENAQWYSLSRKHEEDPRVETAHRDFLLCRDLYITTITMLVLTVAGMITKIIQCMWLPIVYLVILLVLTNIAAHFKAHRFVNSVIAVDLNPKRCCQ